MSSSSPARTQTWPKILYRDFSKLRISSLHWAVGGFLVFNGALLLVAPHQLGFLEYATFQPQLFLWGLLFLISGLALFACAVLSLPRWATAPIHLVIAALLLGLAVSFSRTGAWIGPLNYTILAFGVASGAVFPGVVARSQEIPRGDLLSLLVGIATILTGSAMLLRQFHPAVDPFFNLPDPLLVVFGILFILSGAWLSSVHILAVHRQGKEPALGGLIAWPSHVFTAVLFISFLILTTFPEHFWFAASYFGVFGLSLAFIPLIASRLDRHPIASLRTRLALIFAVATGIPLILTLALISNREETLVKDESMARLQDQAEVLAHSFDDYIEIHQSALNLLASNRSILDLSHAEQQQMLESLRRDFQDVAAISLYDASGSSLASSDPARIPTSLAGNLMFESARNNGKSALDVLQAPGIQRPVFALGDPIFDRSGKFTGLLTIELESDRIFSELNKQFESSDIEIFLVDSRGRAIATPDLSVIQSFSDLSSSPAVSKFLTGISPSGTVLYETQIGQRLASYYGIPHLGWGVIVEQPAEVALSGVNTGRDLAFGILILFLLFTTLGGIWLAGQLTTPINSLAHATKKLTSGDTHVPLPHTGIIEVQQLADAFGEMRDRLSARSAELEQALQDLQMAKEELESRIAALMQAEEKLVYQAYLLESASDAIVATNTDFKLTAWNRVAEETYGWKAEEAIGQDSFKLFRSQISRAERQRVLEVLAETGSYFGRMTQYRKDGKAIEVELRTKALKNSSGEVVGYMSVNQDITQRKQMEAELAEVKSKLIDRDEAEHLRIARELHDGPMQELYGLIFRLESMDAQKEGRQDTDVGYIKQKIQEVIQSLRTTTVTLRPPSLAPFGLERAIRGHAESLLRAHPELDLHLILMHDEQTLPERVRLALFRIYQVAITNVIRHAQAHSVQIKLTLDVEEVCLEVQDDGQGFEMPESMIELARRGHLGLVGAAERAEAVGGRLEVVSSIGKGTLVRVVVPRKEIEKVDLDEFYNPSR